MGIALITAYTKQPSIVSNYAHRNAGTSASTSINVTEKADDLKSEESQNNNKMKQEKEMKLKITVGDQAFIATLEDNKTANAFQALLPLTMNMGDVNGNEKYYVLPKDIKKDPAANPGKINAGDIMCYGEDGCVFFYKSFSTIYNYVPIAHIDDAKTLADVLGSGNAKVTISVLQK